MIRNEMKSPEELVSAEKRQPVSARIKEGSAKILKAEAKRLKVPVSSLFAAILDDYAEWVRRK